VIYGNLIAVCIYYVRTGASSCGFETTRYCIAESVFRWKSA